MRFQGGFALSEVLPACGLPPGSLADRDLSLRFQSLDSPEFAGPESLVILGSGARLSDIESLKAGLVLAEKAVAGLPPTLRVLRVANARRVMAELLRNFSSRIFREPGLTAGGENAVAEGAVVEGVLGGGVIVGAGACVGRGSFIGPGTRIEPGAVIQENVRIGANGVVQSGAVIGCAGFGFFEAGGDLEPMPHFAGVDIGKDCFVGANSVIAAGVLHPTILGDGCKLDSHVQIAHNVRLGRDCLLASQSGIAGSTRVGDGFRMGGAASVAGHLRIGSGVSVAACSGVTKDVPDGATVAGFPARPIREWRRREGALRRFEAGSHQSPEGDFA